MLLSLPGVPSHPNSRGRRGIAAKAPYRMNLSIWGSKGPVMDWQNHCPFYTYSLYVFQNIYVHLCVCEYIFTLIYMHNLDIFVKYIYMKQAPQGSGHSPKPVGVQEVLGHCSWIWGLTCSLPCVESEVGLHDPHGSFPTQESL